MAAPKKRFPLNITPRAVFVWPKLDEPDMKFAKNGVGSYSIKLRLDRDDADHLALIEKIEAAHAAGLESARVELEGKLAEATTGADKKKFKTALAELVLGPNPVKAVADDNGDDTNEVEVMFKMPESYKDKTGKVVPIKPIVVDAAKARIDPSETAVWGGSEGKVSFQMRPYYNAATKAGGVSLRLIGVQVLKLVQGGGGDGGFAEEEGFKAEAPQVTAGAGADEDDEPAF